MACQPQDQPSSIKEQQSMHPLTRKQKLGHSNIAASLNHHQRLKESRLYPIPQSNCHRDSPWGQFSRDAQEVHLLPSITGYEAACDSPFPGSIPVSAQPKAGRSRSSVAEWRRGGSPHLLPAPLGLACGARALACTSSYPFVSHLGMVTDQPL